MTRSDLVSRVSAIFPYVNVVNVERIISIIIDFVDTFLMKPEDIRKTIVHLDWKNQMQIVLDSL